MQASGSVFRGELGPKLAKLYVKVAGNQWQRWDIHTVMKLSLKLFADTLPVHLLIQWDFMALRGSDKSTLCPPKPFLTGTQIIDQTCNGF